jgi:hypothetical protein
MAIERVTMWKFLAGLPSAVLLGLFTFRIFTYDWWDFHWKLFLAVDAGLLERKK